MLVRLGLAMMSPRRCVAGMQQRIDRTMIARYTVMEHTGSNMMVQKIPNDGKAIRSNAFSVIWEFISIVSLLDKDTLAKRVLTAKPILDEGSLTREDFLAVGVSMPRSLVLLVRYQDIMTVFATGDYEEGMLMLCCFLEDCIDPTSCSWVK
jgi:hypothetical protein